MSKDNKRVDTKLRQLAYRMGSFSLISISRIPLTPAIMPLISASGCNTMINMISFTPHLKWTVT